jgi:hypothetical protein
LKYCGNGTAGHVGFILQRIDFSKQNASHFQHNHRSDTVQIARWSTFA